MSGPGPIPAPACMYFMSAADRRPGAFAAGVREYHDLHNSFRRGLLANKIAAEILVSAMRPSMIKTLRPGPPMSNGGSRPL